MKHAEQEQISKGLSDIISQLVSLKNQPPNPRPPWPEIADTLGKAHAFFQNILDLFIEQCRRYLNRLNSDQRNFDKWRNLLADLWERMYVLRDDYNATFCYDYNSMIYHHIFIGEMFESLPKELTGARLRFLLVASGDLQVRPLNESLVALAPDWFDEDHLTEFDALKDSETVIRFDCHQEMNLERQAILAHEIFHIIIRENEKLERMLYGLADDVLASDILGDGLAVTLASQLEELLCDYAASWFYGPVYLKAFVDEISYYRIQESVTHPPADLRAKFLLANSARVKSHPGYHALQNYLSLRSRQHIPLPEDSQLRQLGKRFAEELERSNIGRFEYDNKIDQVGRLFEKNIPHVTDDVRNLINNLPSDQRDDRTPKYLALVAESLRKTSILRQAKQYVRDPDALFALPKSLSTTSSRRKS